MRGKKIIVLLSMAGMCGGLVTGCTSGSAPDTRTASDSGIAVIQETDVKASQDALQDMQQGTSQDGTENGDSDSEERWHVLDSETAAVVDADFLGVVWKLDADSFYIVEEFVEILEDGSIMGCSPSSDTEIPDSELIQVVFDDDTYFYVRSIKNGGASYEDLDAGFQDLEEYVSVDLKGQFKDDVFYAEEVRINLVGVRYIADSSDNGLNCHD